MASKKYYVEGSAARVYDFPAEPLKREPQRTPEPKRVPEKKKTVKRFDIFSFVTFSLASVMMLLACVRLISLQSEVTAKKREISKLTNTYEGLVNDNDAVQARIGSDVDLNEIYRIATDELGMVYPKPGQIVRYDKAKEQYVKQYKDVPGVK